MEQLQTKQLFVEDRVNLPRNEETANRIQLHLVPGGSFDAAPPTSEPADGK